MVPRPLRSDQRRDPAIRGAGGPGVYAFGALTTGSDAGCPGLGPGSMLATQALCAVNVRGSSRQHCAHDQCSSLCGSPAPHAAVNPAEARAGRYAAFRCAQDATQPDPAHIAYLRALRDLTVPLRGHLCGLCPLCAVLLHTADSLAPSTTAAACSSGDRGDRGNRAAPTCIVSVRSVP